MLLDKKWTNQLKKIMRMTLNDCNLRSLDFIQHHVSTKL